MAINKLAIAAIYRFPFSGLSYVVRLLYVERIEPCVRGFPYMGMPSQLFVVRRNPPVVVAIEKGENGGEEGEDESGDREVPSHRRAPVIVGHRRAISIKTTAKLGRDQRKKGGRIK
jgi:hypothetical protein